MSSTMPVPLPFFSPPYRPAQDYGVVDIFDDSASDATLEELPGYGSGAPLTRMVDLEYMSSSSVEDSEDFEYAEYAEYAVREEDINYIEEDVSYFELALNGGDGEGPEGDPLLRTTSHTYVHDVIDHLATNGEPPSTPQFLLHATPSHPHHKLLLRRLPSTLTSARELMLWRYLNNTELRRDPWNPSPPALMIVERELSSSMSDRLAHIIECSAQFDDHEREDEAFIAMDPLHDLQENPLKSTADWVDFARQMIQSLVFLHEHNVVQAIVPRSVEDISVSIKMDIGLAPPNTPFSRAQFPVKYYLLDFSKAVMLKVSSPRRVSPNARVTTPRGRPQNIVKLAASRPQVSSIHAKTSFDPINASLVEFVLPISRRRARHDSELTLIPSGLSTPDFIPDIDTPKQSHFLVKDTFLDHLLYPGGEFSADEISSDDDDDEETVKVVNDSTRVMLLATDIKNLAQLLENAMPHATPLLIALAPVFFAMRYSKAGSFTAACALKTFEEAVRGLDFV